MGTKGECVLSCSPDPKEFTCPPQAQKGMTPDQHGAGDERPSHQNRPRQAWDCHSCCA